MVLAPLSVTTAMPQGHLRTKRIMRSEWGAAKHQVVVVVVVVVLLLLLLVVVVVVGGGGGGVPAAIQCVLALSWYF